MSDKYTHGNHNNWPVILKDGKPLEDDDFVAELNKQQSKIDAMANLLKMALSELKDK